MDVRTASKVFIEQICAWRYPQHPIFSDVELFALFLEGRLPKCALSLVCWIKRALKQVPFGTDYSPLPLKAAYCQRAPKSANRQPWGKPVPPPPISMAALSRCQSFVCSFRASIVMKGVFLLCGFPWNPPKVQIGRAL